MAKPIYISHTSLNGYIADETAISIGRRQARRYAFINVVVRPIGTYRYGRKRYRTGGLGDARCHSLPDTGHPSLREDLATG